MGLSQNKYRVQETDPDFLVEKFVNQMMWGGKKTVSRRILSDAFKTIADKTKKDPKKVFEEAIRNVSPAVEVRPRRVGGSVYQIPMQVKPHRQRSLAFRWLIGAARNKSGAAMAQKLATELMEAAENQGAAIKKKEDAHRMAESNKAFAHFARY